MGILGRGFLLVVCGCIVCLRLREDCINMVVILPPDKPLDFNQNKILQNKQACIKNRPVSANMADILFTFPLIMTLNGRYD